MKTRGRDRPWQDQQSSLLERMDALIAELNRHNYLYYTLDQPEISDREYDQLYDELKELEQKTGVMRPHSPTQRIGGPLLGGFSTHRHLARFGVWIRRRTSAI